MFFKELARMGIEIRKAQSNQPSFEETPEETIDDPLQKQISGEYRIIKRNEEKKQVFGWALISHEWAHDENGQPILKQLVDYQKDMLDQDEMERIAYNFVMKYRDGGDMHETAGEATCIESICMTVEKQQAMGIPPGLVPVGWWIGFQIHNDELWDLVKKGERRAFSIEGTAIRQKVEIDDPEKYSIAGG